MDLAVLWLGLLLPIVTALDFRYHHQEEMEAFLKSVAQNYSSITHLHSIGKSVRGRSPPAHVPNPQLPFKSSLNGSVWFPVCDALGTRSMQVKHTLSGRWFCALFVVLSNFVVSSKRRHCLSERCIFVPFQGKQLPKKSL